MGQIFFGKQKVGAEQASFPHHRLLPCAPSNICCTWAGQRGSDGSQLLFASAKGRMGQDSASWVPFLGPLESLSPELEFVGAELSRNIVCGILVSLP